MTRSKEALEAGRRFASSVIGEVLLILARLGALVTAIVIDDAPWTFGFGALLVLFGSIYAVGRSKRDAACIALCAIGLVAGALGPTGATVTSAAMGLVALIACFEVVLGVLAWLA